MAAFKESGKLEVSGGAGVPCRAHARGPGLLCLQRRLSDRLPSVSTGQVNYAGVAQLCASGARECTAGDTGGATEGSIRVM